MVRTGATFTDAAAEHLRYIAEDRGRKASTVEDYRSIIRVHLLPAFGEMRLEDVTVATVEAFSAALSQSEHNGRRITPRTQNKVLNVVHGIFVRAKKLWGLSTNPAAEVERHPQRSSGDIDVFSPEEVWALVRAAGDERDAAIYLTAAFTGLQMGELRALHWRDVDFPRSVIRVRTSYAAGELSVPKSGTVRSVPLVFLARAEPSSRTDARSMPALPRASTLPLSPDAGPAPRCARGLRRARRLASSPRATAAPRAQPPLPPPLRCQQFRRLVRCRHSSRWLNARGPELLACHRRCPRSWAECKSALGVRVDLR